MTHPQPGSADYAAAPLQKKTMSVVSLVLGIVGVVLSFIPILGIILGVLAVVFGFLGRSREAFARGFWLTGLILGIVAIVAAIIWIVIAAVVVAGSLNRSN